MSIFDKITSKFQFRLKDRANAANILGEALKDVIKNKEERKASIVLGIPRGGVIVGDIIARKLSCEFDIIIPRKLRAPHSEELAIGAIMEDGTTYLNDMLVKELEVSQEYIEEEKAYQIQEIKRRSSLYRRNSEEKEKYELRNNNNNNKKYVILADDGAATGATIIAAARWIRKKQQQLIIVTAVPVAPKQTKDLLKKEADHVEVITSPSTSNFNSVGQYYQSFEPLTDEQVIEIMKKRREIYHY
jgi:predicted phosphoribosyltransferase